MAITNPDGSAYTAVFHPDPHLQLAIVKAWSDPNYRSALLTDEDEVPLQHGTAQRNYSKTKSALQEVGFDAENPVVITVEQYQRHYQRQSWEEVVLVLPEQIARGSRTLPVAKTAMAITPCGM